MIAELLSVGEENARTGKELAKIIGCDMRDITAAVERERRQGQPICAATSGNNPGYFIAAGAEDIERYCRRLHHRAGEIYKTRQALLNILKEYAATKNSGG